MEENMFRILYFIPQSYNYRYFYIQMSGANKRFWIEFAKLSLKITSNNRKQRFLCRPLFSVNCLAFQKTFISLHRGKKKELDGRTVVTYARPFQILERRRNVFPSLIYWTVKACERAKLLWRMLGRELNLLHCLAHSRALTPKRKKEMKINSI